MHLCLKVEVITQNGQYLDKMLVFEKVALPKKSVNDITGLF